MTLDDFFRGRDASPRWKQVVEPAPGRFTHRLEFRSAEEIDDEVRTWLAEAWQAAAQGRDSDRTASWKAATPTQMNGMLAALACPLVR
jgi:Domain of unknown function (DUF5655)